jgi:hypothetical protein
MDRAGAATAATRAAWVWVCNAATGRQHSHVRLTSMNARHREQRSDEAISTIDRLMRERKEIASLSLPLGSPKARPEGSQ